MPVIIIRWQILWFQLQ